MQSLISLVASLQRSELETGIISAAYAATQQTRWTTSTRIARTTMVFYRFLFVLFGLAVGWLLWQKNRRERDARQLAETLKRFQLEYGAAAVLIHAKLQILLTRGNLNLFHDAQELIRSAYEKSQALQTLVKERLPAQE